jgi:hypothetical protein
MGGLKHLKTEGGQGGRRGHSGMDHSDETADVKNAARRLRRREAKKGIAQELGDLPKERSPGRK